MTTKSKAKRPIAHFLARRLPTFAASRVVIAVWTLSAGNAHLKWL